MLSVFPCPPLDAQGYSKHQRSRGHRAWMWNLVHWRIKQYFYYTSKCGKLLGLHKPRTPNSVKTLFNSKIVWEVISIVNLLLYLLPLYRNKSRVYDLPFSSWGMGNEGWKETLYGKGSHICSFFLISCAEVSNVLIFVDLTRWYPQTDFSLQLFELTLSFVCFWLLQTHPKSLQRLGFFNVNIRGSYFSHKTFFLIKYFSLSWLP
jgi:hypothetical protein